MFIRNLGSFLIQENIKQAKSFLDNLEVPEDKRGYFNKLKNELNKTPNLVYTFTKIVYDSEDPGSTFDESLRVINWIKRNKQILNKLPKDIIKYDNLEELSDDISNLEKNQLVDKFIKSLYRSMRDSISRLNEEDQQKFNELAYKFMKLDEEERTQFTPLKFFKVNDVSIGEFIKSLESFLNKSSANDQEGRVRQYIKDNGDKLEVTYDENGVIVVKTKDKEALCELGSDRWCIVYSDNYRKSYTSGYKTQFIIRNFNLPDTNVNSMFGVTILPDNTEHSRGASQNKDNRYIPLPEIIEKTGIPEEALHSDYYQLYLDASKDLQESKRRLSEDDSLGLKEISEIITSLKTTTEMRELGVKPLDQHDLIINSTFGKFGIVNTLERLFELNYDDYGNNILYKYISVGNEPFTSTKIISANDRLINWSVKIDEERFNISIDAEKVNGREVIRLIKENIFKIDEEMFNSIYYILFYKTDIGGDILEIYKEYISLKKSKLKSDLNCVKDFLPFIVYLKQEGDWDYIIDIIESVSDGTRFTLFSMMESSMEYSNSKDFKYFLPFKLEGDIPEVSFEQYIKFCDIYYNEYFKRISITNLNILGFDNKNNYLKKEAFKLGYGLECFISPSDDTIDILKQDDIKILPLIMNLNKSPLFTDIYGDVEISKKFILEFLDNPKPIKKFHYDTKLFKVLYDLEGITNENKFILPFMISPLFDKNKLIDIIIQTEFIGKITPKLIKRCRESISSDDKLKLEYDIFIDNFMIDIISEIGYEKGFNFSKYFTYYKELKDILDVTFLIDNLYEIISHFSEYKDSYVNEIKQPTLFNDEEIGVYDISRSLTEELIINGEVNDFDGNLEDYINENDPSSITLELMGDMLYLLKDEIRLNALSYLLIYRSSVKEMLYDELGLEQKDGQYVYKTTIDELSQLYDKEIPLGDDDSELYVDVDYYYDQNIYEILTYKILSISLLKKISNYFIRNGWDYDNSFLEKYDDNTSYDELKKIHRNDKEVSELQGNIVKVLSEDDDDEFYKEVDVETIVDAFKHSNARTEEIVMSDSYKREVEETLSPLFKVFKGTNNYIKYITENDVMVCPDVEEFIMIVGITSLLNYANGNDITFSTFLEAYLEGNDPINVPSVDDYYPWKDEDEVMFNDEVEEQLSFSNIISESVILKYSDYISERNLDELDNKERFISEFNDEDRAIEELEYYTDAIDELIKNGGEIYRLIFLEHLSDLNKNDLGYHWTFDRDNLSNFYNSLEVEDENMLPYLIIAQIEPNQIDEEISFGTFEELPHELEINLKTQPKRYKVVPYKETHKAKMLWKNKS